MKNLSCFKCHFHRCVNRNICVKKKCKLKEGYYYNASNKIVKESDGLVHENLNQDYENVIKHDDFLTFVDSLLFLN